MLILDTNVLSELISPHRSPAVPRALARFPASTLATTSVSEAELRSGAARLAEGRRRTALVKAIDDLLAFGLGGRVFPFDRQAARSYAELTASRLKAGRPIAEFDAMIAAICLITGATLATRNISDFQGCGIELIDPWSAA